MTTADQHRCWAGRRVLVTGADGFLGSHLCERLVALGARLHVAVRARSDSGTSELSLRHLARLTDRLEGVLALDVADRDAPRLLAAARPEVIFHLAAVAYVPFSFDHPFEVHRTNATGTLNVLEAARGLDSLDRLVVTSSSEVYGTAQRAAIDEDHPLAPTSPYAASKLAADRYAHAYRETFGLPVSIIRPFNCYGPRHVYDVVPKFMKAVLRGEPPTVHGDGRQRRDLTYVTDMIEAFLLMGGHPAAAGRTVHFGSGRDVSILELAETIIEISGKPLEPVFIETRLAEVARLTCDAGLARRLFGWAPAVSLRDGLERHFEWFVRQGARGAGA